MFYPRLISLALFVFGLLGIYLINTTTSLSEGFTVQDVLIISGVVAGALATAEGFYGILFSFGVERTGDGFDTKKNWFGKTLAFLNGSGNHRQQGYCSFTAWCGLCVTGIAFFIATFVGFAIEAFTDFEQFLWQFTTLLAILAGVGSFFGLLILIGKLSVRYPRIGGVTSFLLVIGLIFAATFVPLPPVSLGDIIAMLAVVAAIAAPFVGFFVLNHYLKRIRIHRRICPTKS